MEQFVIDNLAVFIILGLWSLFWTGLALWRAARLNKKWWFILILVINSLGILEILYLFVFSKEKNSAYLDENSQK